MIRLAQSVTVVALAICPTMGVSQQSELPQKTVTLECTDGSLTVRVSMRDVMRVCLGE
jgi:hypothetical protein